MVNPPATHVLMEGHVLVVMGLTDDLQNLPRTERESCAFSG